ITNVSGGGCAALPCTIPSLASGADATITVTATINAAGAFDNSATALAVETDPNLTNNTDDTGNDGTAEPSADVSLVKTLTTAGPYTAGQSITYTLVVANAGPSTATTIEVTDAPSNLTITSVSGSGCAALPCTIASLASGADTTITVTATVDAAGAFDNSATALAVETDPNLTNNTDDTGNNGITGASADVSVDKTLTTAGPYSAGQSITYTLVIGNAGPSTATNVQVTDTPTNLTITNVSGGGCAALPCTIPNLAVGASVTITITAAINGSGAFDNLAGVDAAEPDPNTDNNIDDTGNNGIVAPPTEADVAVTKTASAGTISIGEQVDFILTVRNNGPATATNVVVSDALPANFAFISATPTQGSCSGTTTVTCNVGTMLSGATVTITIRGTVTTTPSMTNTATVAATETDPVPGNNTSTISLSAAPAAIPTASEWGLLLMALLLAVGGAFAMRMR
ncbi:MAG: IPTL-CTERM sorting domain-containing protein, partial [Thermoanaerobaculia bacterium]